MRQQLGNTRKRITTATWLPWRRGCRGRGRGRGRGCGGCGRCGYGCSVGVVCCGGSFGVVCCVVVVVWLFCCVIVLLCDCFVV